MMFLYQVSPSFASNDLREGLSDSTDLQMIYSNGHFVYSTVVSAD